MMFPNGSFDGYNETANFDNSSDRSSHYFQPFGETYRTVATVVYTVIFLLGITGNSIVIFTIYASRSLHTSAYAYLVSLACADLLVICTSVPENLVYTISSGLWYSDSFVCAVFVFMTFFCIDVGTLSMVAFTLERYMAICRPFLAKKLCTLKRSRKIIACCWIVPLVYCSPWLAVAKVEADEKDPEKRHCELSLSHRIYTAFFVIDLVLFYIVPLMGGMLVYWKIGRVLRNLSDVPGTVNILHLGHEMEQLVPSRSLNSRKSVQQRVITPEQPLFRNGSVAISHFKSISSVSASRCDLAAVVEGVTDHPNHQPQRNVKHPGLPNTRRKIAQNLRIFVATVLLFALSWLPFRGLLIYNSLAEEPWLDSWYALFSKCMIFLNCCVNPLLYTLLFTRFRDLVKLALTFKKLASMPTRSAVWPSPENHEQRTIH